MRHGAILPGGGNLANLVALVRAGAAFTDGKLVERLEDKRAQTEAA